MKTKAELSEKTNPQYCVQRATVAIAAHTGDEYPENDARTQMVDLIADLLHYADANELNFAECERMARRHYLNERHGN